MKKDTTMNMGSVGVKTDCFAYVQETKDCAALNKLFCKKERCSFYKKCNQVDEKTKKLIAEENL